MIPGFTGFYSAEPFGDWWALLAILSGDLLMRRFSFHAAHLPRGLEYETGIYRHNKSWRANRA